MKTKTHLKIPRGGGVQLLAVSLMFSALTSSAAIEFRRGDENAATFTRDWSDYGNWSNTRAGSSNNHSTGEPKGSWVGNYTYYDNSLKQTVTEATYSSSKSLTDIKEEIYFGPNSSYNGEDAVGVNGNDGWINFDVGNARTYRWFVGFWGGSPAYANTALGIRAEGENDTVTIDNSYNIGAATEKPSITTYFASNDFTFDVSFDLMCIKNTSGGAVTNTFDLTSTYNTYFATGRTIKVTYDKAGAVTASAGAATPLTIQTYVNSSATDKKVYMGSQIISNAVVHVRAGSGAAWGTANTNQMAIVEFCGIVSNDIPNLSLWRKSSVDFNMKDNATVVKDNGVLTMGNCNTVRLLGENQLRRARVTVASEYPNGNTGIQVLNLNGHSLGYHEKKDTVGSEEWAVDSLTMSFAREFNALDFTLDYGANSDAQVFAARALDVANNLTDPSLMNLDFFIKNFVVGEDRFICGFELDSSWIGDQTTDGYIKFEGYTVADGYYITCTQIDDMDDFFDGAYEYTVVAIPEPSTIAAILGLVALVFVIRRKRA